MACKARDEYGSVMHLVKANEKLRQNNPAQQIGHDEENTVPETHNDPFMSGVAPPPPQQLPSSNATSQSQALALAGVQQQALIPKKTASMPKPNWHPPWKLYRVKLYTLFSII